MTHSNIRISQAVSLRSYGICQEAPYVASLLERHRQQEAAVRERIDKIRERYNQIKIMKASV